MKKEIVEAISLIKKYIGLYGKGNIKSAVKINPEKPMWEGGFISEIDTDELEKSTDVLYHHISEMEKLLDEANKLIRNYNGYVAGLFWEDKIKRYPELANPVPVPETASKFSWLLSELNEENAS